MTDPLTRDPGSVRGMFGRIAPRYDWANRLLSLGLDLRWRRRVAQELALEPHSTVLDLCGGTGDLAIALLRETAARVVCCDFSHPMLLCARAKLDRRRLGDRCPLVRADALALPFPDGCFDAATVAFGLRNLADPGAGLREILRILRPGGKLAVLEFSVPEAPIRSRLFRLYLGRVVPTVGGLVSGEPAAYTYLAETIGAFPPPDLVAGWIREAGFAGVAWTPLTGGIVCAHVAVKGLRESSRAPVRGADGPG